MRGQRSVARRLGIGLSLVGIVGTILLLIVVVLEYRLSFADLKADLAMRRAMREMFEHVALPVLVLIVPTAIASLLVIRRAFAPLTEAAERLDASRGRERGVRIDASLLPTEAAPFANAINNLLGRLDEAADLHKAFAADVAHELRTPLAVLSLELDNLDHPHAARLKEDVSAMRRLLDQLMLLAQVDSGVAAATPPVSIILGDIGAEVVALLAPGAINEGRTIALDVIDPQVAVSGHREAIAAALRNLVENAIRATPAGGSITVIVGPSPCIRVRDEGPGLTPERLRVLIRRHSRADHASAHGAGLGLAIADRIMTAHGGKVTTDVDRREIILHFPA
ncbi:sensor histidine kinase [Sphingobium aquiterrae]|uniref:sensor histidine kinase n=1 Tax=Sphingobium aquiterrae TaxID=2038656 RepID=UPI003019D85D